MRLDARLVKKLSERAEELGIGLTVLLRRYIEAMAFQDDTGLGRPVSVSRDELNFLTDAVIKCGKLNDYAEMLANAFEVALKWR